MPPLKLAYITRKYLLRVFDVIASAETKKIVIFQFIKGHNSITVSDSQPNSKAK